MDQCWFTIIGIYIPNASKMTKVKVKKFESVLLVNSESTTPRIPNNRNYPLIYESLTESWVIRQGIEDHGI